jgi:hypothetical protein
MLQKSFALAVILFSQCSCACLNGVTEFSEVMGLLKDFPGSSEYLEGVIIQANTAVKASDYWEDGELDNKYVVIVCSDDLEVKCENGIYPLGPSGDALEEIKNDYFVMKYWNDSGYFNTKGSIGPHHSSAMVERAQIYCGEHYCRVIYSLSHIYDLPTYPESYARHKLINDMLTHLPLYLWPLILWVVVKKAKREGILSQIMHAKYLWIVLLINAIIMLNLLSRMQPMC